MMMAERTGREMETIRGQLAPLKKIFGGVGSETKWQEPSKTVRRETESRDDYWSRPARYWRSGFDEFVEDFVRHDTKAALAFQKMYDAYGKQNVESAFDFMNRQKESTDDLLDHPEARDKLALVAATLKHFGTHGQAALEHAKSSEDVPWTAAYALLANAKGSDLEYELKDGVQGRHLLVRHLLGRLTRELGEDIHAHRGSGEQTVPQFSNAALRQALGTSISPKDKSVVSRIARTATGKARLEAAFPHLNTAALPHQEARSLFALTLLQDAQLGGRQALDQAARGVGSMQSAVSAGQRITAHMLISAALEGIPHPEPIKDLIGRLQRPGISQGWAVLDTRPGVTVAHRIEEMKAAAGSLREENRDRQMAAKAAAARKDRDRRAQRSKNRIEASQRKRSK